MSVQFGECNFDGKTVNHRDLEEVRPALAPYAPDGEGYICKDNVGIVYRGFQTTTESRHETQPHVSTCGLILTWDGRLDNREELISQVASEVTRESTDVEIVAAAYQRWRTDAFARLIGDWAASIWDPAGRSLVLAKDFLGARQLYYAFQKQRVTWSTVLELLLARAGCQIKLQEEYVAGWLGSFPAPQLTPYAGIQSVPPSCFVRFTPGTHVTTKYWDFNPALRLRYRHDSDYEEHFRHVFSQSVRRRLRAFGPVLAELSGGMDSSSIVCTADCCIGRGDIRDVEVDTVSYYDDSEPNWNERPYFTKVEQNRGRIGCHINLSQSQPFNCEFACDRFALPSSGEVLGDAIRQFAECINSKGYRVLLSGIGGDEVTGGVPTPIPELADLLVRARFVALARQLKVWALAKRKPWLHLLLDTISEFRPSSIKGRRARAQSYPWLANGFVARNQSALRGYPHGLSVFGPLPSFQENVASLNALRSQIVCSLFPIRPYYEKRYPFLDRDFLSFIFALPPEQLIRPGQRRSLLRRALAGIVPDEILQRRRKAFVARSPRVTISEQSTHVTGLDSRVVADELQIISAHELRRALKSVESGLDLPVVAVQRALTLELWLRALVERGFWSKGPLLRTVSLASAART